MISHVLGVGSICFLRGTASFVTVCFAAQISWGFPIVKASGFSWASTPGLFRGSGVVRGFAWASTGAGARLFSLEEVDAPCLPLGVGCGSAAGRSAYICGAVRGILILLGLRLDLDLPVRGRKHIPGTYTWVY